MPTVSTTLAVDLGSKRVGIAISDSGVLATPHSVLSGEGDVVEKVALLGGELEAETYVVGIPRRAVRNEAAERKFHDFAQRLRQRTCKEVVLWDESFTTVQASEQLRAAGRPSRKNMRDIDMHAAAVILQSWLDHQVDQRRTP
jgi:putative Holliday junction resolvase